MRTRVIIQKRSCLDPGTESRSRATTVTDYVYPPSYSVTSVLDNTSLWPGRRCPGRLICRSRNNPGRWGSNVLA